ncbi:hypothetical protein [Streptomyces profundus]|nr:hypothetical protein [Streptomyces sp. MA3_2.13]UED85454.1 hypothetical protein K4G22_15635 [Streptomyces sp. MA3_2.13]
MARLEDILNDGRPVAPLPGIPTREPAFVGALEPDGGSAPGGPPTAR